MIARTILALDCLTDLLTEEHEAIRNDSLKAESHGHYIELIDKTERHLMSSRALLVRNGIGE